MLRFIYRPKELAQCAQEIVSKSRKPLVAVAFWGAEIIEHLGLSLGNTTIKNSFDEVRIILNLAAGGTNASVVEQLRKAAKEFKKVGVNLTLRQSDKLHAKVWIGDNRVLVSSANASVNGLSFDSATQNCWNEAGLMVDDKTIVDEIRRWFERYWMDENQCRDISDTDLVRCPRRGPPAPPQNKPRSLSNILREDLCPIKLTILVGENTDAANKAASRQINKLKKVVINPKTLDKLSNFEIAKDYDASLWKASDYAVGVNVKVGARFSGIFPPTDAKFVRVSSVDSVFYQVPSADLLGIIESYDRKTKTWNSYAWDKGRTIDLADHGRIRFDAKSRSEIKSALERRWKNKKVAEIGKDEGILLWEIFK
jgi:hypothetical protein